MVMTQITSREFNQDTSRAKKAAEAGPVYITDRGRPAHVLLTFDAYEQLAIYYEHRARCPEKALGLVREALVRLRESHGSGGTAEERYRKWHGRLRRRLARLERKCAR